LRARWLCRSSIIVDLPVVSYGVHFTPPGAAGTPSATVADAVDHLLGGDIDIVLLDCVLPDGPNWQVALEADRQDIPVVFMTGGPGQAKELIGRRPSLSHQALRHGSTH
jgi:CheY-like chemotaxis protein